MSLFLRFLLPAVILRLIKGDVEMSADDKFSLKWGVVTFLDFLGWKGIWINDYKNQLQPNGTSSRTSLESLAVLINEAKKACKEFDPSCKFISISDTIALFSPSPSLSKEDDEVANYEMLKLHSKICSKMLDMFALKGFALRGAITIGKYAHHKNILVGPGVDECASWYEQTDWLGVIFAPSAQFIIDEQYNKSKQKQRRRILRRRNQPSKLWSDSKIIRYNDIPVKGSAHKIQYCVDWGNDPEILNAPLQKTISLSREIAIKYINTNKYLYNLQPKRKISYEDK